MTRSTTAFGVSCSALVLVLLGTAGAHAQSCGDADGSGNVTVTDGVQTLRAAAGLSSTCTAARCDVDGSGSVSVTDGVNVLRKAAGLSAPSACLGASGDGIQASVDAIVPFFAFGFAFASDVSLAGAAAVQPAGDVEDPCPDGGVRAKHFLSPGILRIGFTACRYSSPGLGRFEFNQGLVVNFLRAQVALSVLVTDLDGTQLRSFDGFFDFVPRDGGGFFATGQDITIANPPSVIKLDLNQLEVDGEGHVLSGGGSIEEETSPGTFTLQRIDFQVTGPGTASLTATFDDGSTSSFVVNLITGDLSQ